MQHSRSSTSSASSSTFPMGGMPYDHYRRTSGLMYQVDPARIAEDDGVGQEEDDFAIRGWQGDDKLRAERRESHQQCASKRSIKSAAGD